MKGDNSAIRYYIWLEYGVMFSPVKTITRMSKFNWTNSLIIKLNTRSILKYISNIGDTTPYTMFRVVKITYDHIWGYNGNYFNVF